MKLLKNFLLFFAFFGILTSNANSIEIQIHPVVSLNLGFSQFTLDNTILRVTETEVDNLRQTHNPVITQWGAGIEFLNFNNKYAHLNALPRLTAGLNFYYQNHTLSDRYISGEIEQYQDPLFTNYHYQLGITTKRLMLDFNLGLITIKPLTLFAIGGLGYGNILISYSDFPNEGIEGGGLILQNKNHNKLASEIGARINYQYNKKTQFYMEYLYNFFGKVSTGTMGSLNGSLAFIGPAAFSLNSNSLMWGILLNMD